MPFLVAGMYAVRRHYAHVAAALRARRLTVARDVVHRFIVLVPDIRPATHEAVAQARALRPTELVGVYVGTEQGAAEAAAWWAKVAPRSGPLERLPQTGYGRWGRLREWLSGFERDERTFVTVVVPEEVEGSSVWQLLTRQRRALMLKVRLLFTPDVVVTDVLPPNVRFDSFQNSGFTTIEHENGVVTLTRLVLNPGASSTARLSCIVDPFLMTNTAVASQLAYETSPQDNLDDAVTTLTTPAAPKRLAQAARAAARHER